MTILDSVGNTLHCVNNNGKPRLSIFNDRGIAVEFRPDAEDAKLLVDFLTPFLPADETPKTEDTEGSGKKAVS